LTEEPIISVFAPDDDENLIGRAENGLPRAGRSRSRGPRRRSSREEQARRASEKQIVEINNGILRKFIYRQL
jgi:hypothetical protein